MYLPPPTYAFIIPSLYDEIQLECRVYLPHGLLQSKSIRGAIVAHPYAPLGGCYDDPVVNFMGGELLEAGYIVGTFNFRGAGNSEGRTSWTAKPELADYASFYSFMLCYMHSLRLLLVPRLENRTTQQEINERHDVKRAPTSETIHLILGGYSYGSLIASHLPSSDVILELLKCSIEGTPSYAIIQTAERIAASILKCDDRTTKHQSTGGASKCIQPPREALDVPQINISYLIISPLLPPVNLFLTLFSTMSLDVGATLISQGRQILCPKPNHQQCLHRTLAIYGNQDTFTPVSKLRKWSDGLINTPQSQFHSVEIDGAGHFWRERGAETQARDALREWLRMVP
ncbi:Alpha/Beta hydrolase protein [Aspergillus avenaceus]|uniref:Alpha/Beta hydrolase protein n=1 Tax=Aspergillus avenaceus TaxID=36643 RepID=A0A5N6U242_ASPAV|nr:Alpha/Beta hydrolase protein [Aspergillus avenaceus]